MGDETERAYNLVRYMLEVMRKPPYCHAISNPRPFGIHEDGRALIDITTLEKIYAGLEAAMPPRPIEERSDTAELPAVTDA